jgi:hypothetical protein
LTLTGTLGCSSVFVLVPGFSSMSILPLFCAQLHPAITRVKLSASKHSDVRLVVSLGTTSAEHPLTLTVLIVFHVTRASPPAILDHSAPVQAFWALRGHDRGQKGLYRNSCVRRYLFDEHGAVQTREDSADRVLLLAGAWAARCSRSNSRDFGGQRSLRGDAHG